MTDELQRAMGRVEAKVDLLIERDSKLDKRLNAVEKKVYWASGASAIVAYIATHILGKQ